MSVGSVAKTGMPICFVLSKAGITVLPNTRMSNGCFAKARMSLVHTYIGILVVEPLSTEGALDWLLAGLLLLDVVACNCHR